MKLPLRWLKEYVDYRVTNEEFVERMMWRGFEVAAIEPELPGAEDVIVGRVESVARHENSDHLYVCRVNTGSETLQIVTGADNLFPGALVPVAPVGARLGQQVMQRVNMRGVESCGMLCSGKELGLTEADYPGSEVYGILILRGEHPLGQPIAEAVGLDSVVFDIELTPNRPDCASIIGICREAAAALGQPFTEPAIAPVAGTGNEADYASVTVENGALCPRYTARVVTDIHIEPSPAWMQRKLRSVGLRPINNIVDITNYVLVEYGHPMHAFDLACVAGGHIVVRNAFEGEVVTTLDGKARPVTPEMLLIADPQKGVGIAGVMGGENSEITDRTQVVLFESAVFKGSNIRKTARTLRHMTDAAARFIKGVEPVNAQLALDRAIELVEQLHAGRVVGKTIDVCAADLATRTADIDVAHVNRLLALDLTAAQMAEMLATIGIPSEPQGGRLLVHIPHFRTDIETGVEADADIAEEIARIYGYYNIEPTLMRGDTFTGRIDRPFAFEDRVKDTLVALGGYEMYNYNFTGPAALDALRLAADDEKRQAVRILNPFGEEQSLMRTTLYIGMLDAAARNRNRRTGQGRFFEVGNVHFDNDPTLPEERKMAGLLFFGEEESFYTLKGAIEALFDACNVRPRAYARTDSPYFQPGRAAVITAEDDGAVLGELGQVHPDVARAFGLDCPAYMAELSMQRMCNCCAGTRRFCALPRFPLVPRDLAVVVDRSAETAQLKRIIETAQDETLVENVTLFDTYEGPGVGEGKKSLAFSFTLRAEDHTLNDEQIKRAMDAIIAALEKNGAPLRA